MYKGKSEKEYIYYVYTYYTHVHNNYFAVHLTLTQHCKSTILNNCSHETKRHLFLGRKAMTNLDSVLKRRDIFLPPKVRIVKAMVFLVVTYGCENWTIKKAEC